MSLTNAGFWFSGSSRHPGTPLLLGDILALLAITRSRTRYTIRFLVSKTQALDHVLRPCCTQCEENGKEDSHFDACPC